MTRTFWLDRPWLSSLFTIHDSLFTSLYLLRPLERARSIDAAPPPDIKSATHTASNVTGNAEPCGTRKPTFQVTPVIAVSMTQKIKKAPTRVRNPKSSNAPPINSAKAAAPIHSQAGRMKGNGAGKLVNFASPVPPKLPSTFWEP